MVGFEERERERERERFEFLFGFCHGCERARNIC